MIDQITTTLLKGQNPDGGWGSVAGKRSNTEATSLSLAALGASEDSGATASAKRATQWLIKMQRQDHSWPLSEAAKEPSWTTALAIMALSGAAEHQERVLGAARWLLAQEGSKPGLLAQLILLVTGKTKVNPVNNDLIGWSWVANSFSWVEPTSYALIALKKLRARLAETNLNERIQQGEAMIYDRMCDGGGWNYGNAKVLDYALWPYPDITALALLALQDRGGAKANQDSLRMLRQNARETNSALALCWASICLSLYGEDVTEFKNAIEKRFTAAGFLGEHKTLALALLALSGAPSPFKAQNK